MGNGNDAAQERAQELAVAGLGWLAADEARLSRYLALTGLDPAQLRHAAAAPGFLAGVLAHLAEDESLLLAFAAENHLRPEDVMKALRALSNEGPPREGSWQESW